MPDQEHVEDIYNGCIVQRDNVDYYGTVTDIGNTRMADALFAKQQLEITDFAVGDGNGYYVRPDPSMTKLVNEVWRTKADVKKDLDNPNVYYITGIIPVNDGNFTIREMGAFNKDGELIAIANAANIEKLTPPQGVFLCMEITIRIIVARADAIKVTIDNDGITCTKKDLENHDKDKGSHDGHFKDNDLHLEPGERDKIYNQVIHFVATLPKEGWKRVGNTFDLEYTVPKELGITITKNMKPTVSSAPDTLMQIIDDEYQILCSQRGGKLTFHALVKPPETTFAIDVYLHRVDEKPEENNLHVSNVLGAETGDGTPLPGPVLNATVTDTSTHQQLSTSGRWTNPTEDYAGTTVVRKRGSIPVDREDGTLIASGNNITSFTDRNNLEIEVPYYYRFFTFNKAGHYQNEPYYVQLTIPCKAAPGVSTFQVTDASTTSETRVKITVSHPVSVYYKETVIVRKGGSSAPTSINDGVIIYRGQASTIYDSDGLASNNSYTWRAFTINKKGSVTPSLSSSVSLVPAVSPQVTNTQLKDTSTDSGGYAVTATWKIQRSTDFHHVNINLKEGSPVESFSDGIRIYSGTAESIEYKTGIKAGGEYYIRAFAVNTAGVPNMELSGATASCVVGGGTPGAITNFRGADSGGTTTLTWTNPTGSSFWALTKIVMKIGSAPTSMTDGEVVYNGTGTSVVLTNRQNGVVYHYAAFACNSSGQASGNPARCSVTPQLRPEYTYTGESTYLDDGSGNWRIKFYTSGVLTWLSDTRSIDVFLVGGGGGGGTGGGGGGYTSTARKVQLSKNQQVRVTVGAGGLGGQARLSYIHTGYEGGSSSFGELTVNGGKPGQSNGSVDGHGGDGGSGGGGYGGPWSGGLVSIKGDGGSDGKPGINVQYYSGGYKNSYGGTGQGTTTREFGEPTGELYSGGGGGGVDQGLSTRISSGNGGDGGYGGGKGVVSPDVGPGGDAINGIGGKGGYANNSGSLSTSRGGGGGGGYGGGGGGGSRTDKSSIDNTQYGKGYQGIVIIRNAR